MRRFVVFLCNIGIRYQFKCATAVAPYKAAALAARQRSTNSVPLDRRRDSVYRVRDQASLPSKGTLPKASPILASAPSASSSTTLLVPRLQVLQRKSSCSRSTLGYAFSTSSSIRSHSLLKSPNVDESRVTVVSCDDERLVFARGPRLYERENGKGTC